MLARSRDRRRFLLVWAGVVASALAATACIPSHRAETLAPALVGSLRYSDNAPGSAMLVAVVEAGADRPCGKATRWVVADQAGRFQMPESYIVRRWDLLFPPIERFWNAFTVCVGRDSASLTPAYKGFVGRRVGQPPDNVHCVVWSARGRSWPSCAGGSQRLVQTGGAWTTPVVSGFYRLLVPGEGSEAPVAVVQWVQRLDGGSEHVVDSLEIPVAPHIMHIGEAELHAEAEGVCVSVQTLGRKAHWYSLELSLVESTLELGPPGQATTRKSCGRR